MEWASLFWKAAFGTMILSSIVFLGYLWSNVKNVTNVLRLTKGLLSALVRNLMRGFAHKEIDALFQNIDQALKKLNRELPQLLENMGGIAASRQQIHLKLKPMNHKPKKEQMMNQCAASAVSRSVRNDMNC